MNIQAHLTPLRNQYPLKYDRLEVDSSCDRRAGEDLHYWYDDREDVHGFHYHDVGVDKLKRGYYIDGRTLDLESTIAMSADGYRVIGQHRKKDDSYELIELPLRTRFPGRMVGFLQRRGWVAPNRVTALPQKAQAFDLGPGGKLAVALGKDVRIHTKAHGLTPWKTFQDKVRDVHYLADGTLAVVTEKLGQYGPMRHDIWLHAPDGTEGHATFKDLYPAKYAEHIEKCLKGVKFLSPERTREESEQCLESLDWLRAPTGAWAEHAALGPTTALVMDAEGATCWTVDPRSGEGRNPRRLEQGMFSQDFKQPLHAAREGRYLLLEGKNTQVWDTTTGKLHALLPATADFQVGETGVRFVDREGASHEVGWEELPNERNQPWYARSLEGQILDGASADRSRLGVRLTTDHVNIGGTTIRRRSR